jgi:hypothetical protein
VIRAAPAYLASNQVARAEQILRDCVNDTGLANDALIERCGTRWPAFCAALDIVGDASLAACAAERYFRAGLSASEPGMNYLMLYGAFQAMVLQQDGARSIAQILGANTSILGGDAAKRVCDLRNKVAGHPLNARTVAGPPQAWGIIRISLSNPERLEPYRWLGGPTRPAPFSIIEVFEEHGRVIRRSLLLSARHVSRIIRDAVVRPNAG